MRSPSKTFCGPTHKGPMPPKESLLNRVGDNPRYPIERKKQMSKNPRLCTAKKNTIDSFFFGVAKKTFICQKKKKPSFGPGSELRLSPKSPPKRRKPP